MLKTSERLNKIADGDTHHAQRLFFAAGSHPLNVAVKMHRFPPAIPSSSSTFLSTSIYMLATTISTVVLLGIASGTRTMTAISPHVLQSSSYFSQVSPLLQQTLFQARQCVLDLFWSRLESHEI